MNLLIGCTIDSLRRTNKQDDCTLIFKEPHLPFVLERHHDEFLELLFRLNLEGKVIFYNKVRSMVLESEHLEVTNTTGAKIKIDFESCEVYSTKDLVVRCTDISGCTDEFLVYDWINVVSIDKVPPHDIANGDGFMNYIWFNVSPKHPKKAVVRSALSEQQLKELEYSDTYVRFLLMNKLQQMGYMGRKNGFDACGKQIHLALDLECTGREVFDARECLYKNTAKVTFELNK